LKLVSYVGPDQHSAVGVQLGDRVTPIAEQMLEFLEGGQPAMEAARSVLARLEQDEEPAGCLDIASVRLLPPVPTPAKCLCVARNYAAHAAEFNRDVPDYPSLFVRVSESLLAHGESIQAPTVSRQLDWEGELAVVIGVAGRHISEQDAPSHVAGYSIFNDVSVRDYQRHTQQFTAGKNFDATGPFGPALVTADEVGDPMNLEIRTLVNGELKQSANTGDMIFGIPRLIAYISEFTTLVPGDVIATGTPAGVGAGMKPPQFLQRGDSCSVEIDRLGELRNTVVMEASSSPQALTSS
jgi:acylpyruvate hydrolase